MAKEVLEMEVKSNVGQVTKEVKNLGTATEKTKGGFKGVGTAIKGMGTALKAAGIGLIVGLMAKLMEVFSKNQKVLDFFNTSMEALSIVFNDLFGFIENNVGAITGFFKDIFENPAEKIKEQGFIDRFDQALEVLGLVSKSFGQLIKGEFSAAFDTIQQAGKETVDVFTGVDDSYEQVAKTISNYVAETVKSAKATVELGKAAELATVLNQGIIEQKDREAELQRQIRDDETKTFEERIKANTELKTILEEQEKLMLANAQAAVDFAQAQKDINANDENKIALQEALNEKDAIKAQIAGFMSEQLTNQVSLEKELGEVKKEVTNASLEGMELELAELKNSYEMQLEMARKAGEDTTAIEKKYAKDRENIKKGEQLTDEEIAANKKKMNIDIANQGLQILGEAAGEGTAIAKAAAIAQATIAGVQGVQNAFTAANANTAATASSFGVYPVTMATLAGAFAAMNISKIASGGKPSASGGGGGGAAPQTPAPQMMSGAFELGGGIKPEPMKAFVVTDEMSNSQNQLANIRRTATI